MQYTCMHELEIPVSQKKTDNFFRFSREFQRSSVSLGTSFKHIRTVSKMLTIFLSLFLSLIVAFTVFCIAEFRPKNYPPGKWTTHEWHQYKIRKSHYKSLQDLNGEFHLWAIHGRCDNSQRILKGSTKHSNICVKNIIHP